MNMKFNIDISERTLHFKQPAGTSRGVYLTRHSWFLNLSSPDVPGISGVGECAPLPHLSCDDILDYDYVLRAVCDNFCESGEIDYRLLRPYPSMLFGLESALLQFNIGGSSMLFDSPFGKGKEGIPINGLVWMGSFEEMSARLEEKMKLGFRCIKLKIGAIDFEQELDLIKQIRQRYSKDDIELRLDANGGFTPVNALRRINSLAKYDIHSLEQPIRQRQWREMAMICRESPIPIALDEELIGVNQPSMKAELLDTIRPSYIILKPSLHGGIHGCEEWIKLAGERKIGSWITSALESNVGLNAIAHFAAHVYGPKITMPQGLGTGLLFKDNIPMPLEIRGDKLWYLQNS
jgi:o-succinylbenzoate synthase